MTLFNKLQALINPHFQPLSIPAVKQNHDVVHSHELNQHAEQHAFFQTVRSQGVQWHLSFFDWSKSTCPASGPQSVSPGPIHQEQDQERGMNIVVMLMCRMRDAHRFAAASHTIPLYMYVQSGLLLRSNVFISPAHACMFALQQKSRTDKNAKEVDPLVPAFTRRREVFAGRLAMFGFAASLIGEVINFITSWSLHLYLCTVHLSMSCLLTRKQRSCLLGQHVYTLFSLLFCLQLASGKGVLGQLSLETSLPQNIIEIALVAGIGYNLFSVSLSDRLELSTAF